jgi:hypothetical protein
MAACPTSSPIPDTHGERVTFRRYFRTGSREQVRFVGGSVGGEDQGFAGDRPVGYQIVEIVGLGGGVLTHREVVNDQYQWSGVFAHALTDGAIGVATGEVGEHAGAFDEPYVAAAAGYGVSKCLCHMCFADADRSVEDD